MPMKRVALIAAAVIAGAAVLAVGLILGRGAMDPDSPPPTAEQKGDVPEGFVLHEDKGFQIAYPEGWESFETDDPEIRLLATPNGKDSFLVRVTDLGTAVNPTDIATANEFLDELLVGRGIKVLDRRQLTLGGAPGWFYLYTFKDGETDEQGVHSHYFLFVGSEMHTLVFQALPKDRFEVLAPTFDQIAQTYRPLG